MLALVPRRRQVRVQRVEQSLELSFRLAPLRSDQLQARQQKRKDSRGAGGGAGTRSGGRR